MARIPIAQLFEASHVTRGDGAKLRALVEHHWNDSEPLILDFAGTRVASVSFFDESLGLLARRHSADELRAHIRVENATEGDRELLNRIVAGRAKERAVFEALTKAGVPVDVLDGWDGVSLALYPDLAGASASLEVARRIAREKAQRADWTLDLGHHHLTLKRESGETLKRRLDDLHVGYAAHALTAQHVQKRLGHR